MIKVFYKELLVNKMQVAIGFLFPLLFLGWGLARNDLSGFLLMVIVYSIVLPFTYLVREQKFKASAVFISLPVRRRSIVAGKYLFAWGSIVSMILFHFLVIKVSYYFSENQPLLDGSWIIVEKFGVLFLFISVIIGLFYPLVLRFGSYRGFIWAMIGIFVANVLLIIGALRSKPFLEDSLGMIEEIPLRFFRALEFLILHYGHGVAYLALFLLIVLINYLSFEVSFALYRKKEF